MSIKPCGKIKLKRSSCILSLHDINILATLNKFLVKQTIFITSLLETKILFTAYFVAYYFQSSLGVLRYAMSEVAIISFETLFELLSAVCNTLSAHCDWIWKKKDNCLPNNYSIIKELHYKVFIFLCCFGAHYF